MPGGVVSMTRGLWWVSSLFSILDAPCLSEGCSGEKLRLISAYSGSQTENRFRRQEFSCLNMQKFFLKHLCRRPSAIFLPKQCLSDGGPNRQTSLWCPRISSVGTCGSLLPATLMLCCPVCLWVMLMKANDGSHRCSTPIKIEQEFKLTARVLACSCKIS